MAEKDPFSQCYDVLKSMLENNTLVQELVENENIVLFSTSSQLSMKGLKDEIHESDLPEVRILPSGITPKVGRDSDHSSFMQKFSVQLATGELAADELLFPLTLALASAWANWQPMFGNLTWQGRKFVHLAQATEAQQGIAIENENRGIRGWATVWSVQVDIWLATEALRLLNTIY